MATQEFDHVRVRFGPGECGWAFDLTDGTYRIDNSPLDENLNYGDVVRFDQGDLMSNPILVSRTFTGKALIRYPADRAVWEQIVERVKPAHEADEACLEGGTPGMAMLSFKESFDPVAALDGLEGVKVEIGDDHGEEVVGDLA